MYEKYAEITYTVRESGGMGGGGGVGGMSGGRGLFQSVLLFQSARRLSLVN